MKTQLYKFIISHIAICFLGTAFAQKVEKKFTENFNVNKNVVITIDATNTAIDVTTWNENKVQVNAFIEIDGLSKSEADEYIKKWNFEALGNKNKVSITSKSATKNNFEDNFIFFNENTFNFPVIDIIDFDSLRFPEMNFDFEMPDLDIILPEMNFDLDELTGKDDNYNLEWNDGVRKIIIKSKKEWEAFKKTKEYKALKKDLKENKKKFKKDWMKSKKQLQKINKKEIKEQLEKVKIEFQKVDKEKIKKQLAKATEELKKMKLNFSSERKNRDLIINGKKVKIKKRLEIKVPAGAMFDLNTRHCKVKMQNTTVSGKVNYGSFDARSLYGGNLKINYSLVTINELSDFNLRLNNVTNATISSVENSIIKSNSGSLFIDQVKKNNELFHNYGELTIKLISPEFEKLKVHLNYSEVTLPLESLPANIELDTKRTKFLYPSKKEHLFSKMVDKIIKKEDLIINEKITFGKKTNNLVKLSANYSAVNVE